MRLYFRLLGVQLSERFGLSTFRAGLAENRVKTISRLLIVVLAIASIGSLVVMYSWLVAKLLPTFIQMRMEKLLLGVVLLFSMIIVFFFGLLYLISVLYFSKDTEFLAALPIPQRTVFAVKLSQVLMGEIVTGAVMLLPPFIIYGVQAGQGLLYWLRMALIVLTVPCIPLALASLLSMGLMRLSVLWRRRELMTIIGSVLLMVALILGQGLLMSRVPDDLSADSIAALLGDQSALLGSVVAAFPPSGWAAEALLGDGAKLLLYIGVSLAGLALAVLLAGRLYYRGMSAQLETASSSKKVTLAGRHVKAHGALWSMFLREWRLVIRSPVYALNGLIVIIMGPLMLVFPLLFQGMEAGSAGGQDMEVLFSLLRSAVDGRLVLLVLAAFCGVMTMISPALTTSLSREGRQFYLLRMIPVSPARQVMAKYLFGLSVGVLTVFTSGISALLMFRLSFGISAGAVALGLLASVAPTALSMLPDIIRPKLAWNSETEAIKQNANGILGMLIGIGYFAGIGFACFAVIRAGVDLSLVIGGAALVSVLLGAASLLALMRAARRSWRVIEG